MPDHGENSLTSPRQDQKLLSLITEYFPLDKISKEHKQKLIEDRTGKIKQILEKAFVPQINISDYKDIAVDFQKFYKEVFGRTSDFSQTSIPANTSNKLSFLQFMLEGLTYQEVHNKEKELYPKYWDWDDEWPDKINLEFEERKTNKNYGIWHSGEDEAEDTFANKSAEWILKKKIETMTRLERGIFGLYIYWKYQRIIDQKFVTYCTGSRYVDGGVPRAGWLGIGFDSFWFFPWHAGDNWRPRPVVS